MIKKLVKAHSAFLDQNPQSPLLNLLLDDITQMQSDDLKNLPKDQRSVFCIGLLWMTKDALAKQALHDSALEEHVDSSLKALTRRFSTSRLLALQAEYTHWVKEMDLPHASATSVI